VAAADQGTGGSGPAVAFGVGGIVLLLAGLGGWLLKRRAL
jgi:LPXTG-motif cell wall-anchored protein